MMYGDFNHVLIDGDILAYKACFTCQNMAYHVCLFPTDEDPEDYLIEVFSSLSAAKKFAEGVEAPTYIRGYKTHQSKHLIFKVIDDLVQGILRELDCHSYTLVLGNDIKDQTFRHKLATTKIYKGQRKEADRPTYLNEARDYIKKKYNPEIAPPELESDDILGIMLVEDSKSIVATIDKDLDMIPGWHYNIDTQEVYKATDPGEIQLVRNLKSPKLRGTGFKWFAAQCLLGDRVDNIEGIRGMGPVKVFKLLDPLETKTEMWNTVANQYLSKKQLLENAQLLWIRRKQGIDMEFLNEGIWSELSGDNNG